MTQKWLEFNCNDSVKIKLTDFGRKELERLHKEEMELLRNSGCRIDAGPAYVEDAEGYVTMQLHQVMSKLGPVMWMNKEPFYMGIFIGFPVRT